MRNQNDYIEELGHMRLCNPCGSVWNFILKTIENRSNQRHYMTIFAFFIKISILMQGLDPGRKGGMWSIMWEVFRSPFKGDEVRLKECSSGERAHRGWIWI